MMTHELKLAAQGKLDANTLQQAQRGDEAALAALFQTHKAKVYALCLRMTANTAEAEDLTQDAFLQIFRKIGAFRGESALSTWLYRVAMNTVLMHFRKKRLRLSSLEEPASREPGAAKREYGKADSRLSSSVDRIALTRAMQELPAGYRSIF